MAGAHSYSIAVSDPFSFHLSNSASPERTLCGEAVACECRYRQRRTLRMCPRCENLYRQTATMLEPSWGRTLTIANWVDISPVVAQQVAEVRW